jgi:hypothetical protein
MPQLDGVPFDDSPVRYWTMPTVSPVQALKDIISQTELMLREGHIHIEEYTTIVSQTVDAIKEIGLKNGNA